MCHARRAPQSVTSTASSSERPDPVPTTNDTHAMRDEHEPPRDVDDAHPAEPAGHERRHGHRGRCGGERGRDDDEEVRISIGHQAVGGSA